MKTLFLIIAASLIIACSYNATALAFSGAKIFFEQNNGSLTVGDEFWLTIFLDTGAEHINSGKAEVLFDNRNLKALSVKNNGSIFSLWVKDPATQDLNSGRIVLSGGLPTPGFIGPKGEIATIVFKALASGKAEVKSISEILKNDGLGTRLSVDNGLSLLNIAKAKPNYQPKKVEEQKDINPPVNLVLDIGRSDYLYSNKYFAAFSAEDKESGVEEYEIAEVPVSANYKDGIYPDESLWRQAGTPHVLQNQNINELVFLRVTDKAGNKAVISKRFELESGSNKLIKLFSVFILLTLLVCTAYFLKKRLLKI